MFAVDKKCNDWLEWFCEDSENETRQIFLMPDGRRAATDGRFSVVASHPGYSISLMIRRRTPPVLLEMLTVNSHNKRMLQADWLVATFGTCEHPSFNVCLHCHGKKNVVHICECELCEADTEICSYCNGDGEEENSAEVRPVKCWGTLFDANRLAYLLKCAPASDSYLFELAKYKDNFMLRVSTAQWSAVVAKLSEEGSYMLTVPEVMAEVAAVTA